MKNELYSMKELYKCNCLENKDNQSTVETFFDTMSLIRLGIVYEVSNKWYSYLHNQSSIPNSKDSISFTINPNSLKVIDNPNYIPLVRWNGSKDSYNRSINKYRYLIAFPKLMNSMTIPTNVGIGAIYELRVIPLKDRFVISIKYTKEGNLQLKYKKKDIYTRDRNRIAGIDFGIYNLIAVANNIGARPLLIKGKQLSTVNAKYNRFLSKLDNKTEKFNSTNNKRLNILTNYLNQTCKKLIIYLELLQIRTLVIGKSKSLQYGFNNKIAYPIPFNYLIEKIKKSCKELDINIVEVDEAYTSCTSILDNQLPSLSNYNSDKRVDKRTYNSNLLGNIDCDVNSAMQIICKYKPNAFKKLFSKIGLYNVQSLLNKDILGSVKLTDNNKSYYALIKSTNDLVKVLRTCHNRYSYDILDNGSTRAAFDDKIEFVRRLTGVMVSPIIIDDVVGKMSGNFYDSVRDRVVSSIE